jgi:catechol 2,3-dioxygenase-like lactoylglutathione lyase family enzyme
MSSRLDHVGIFVVDIDHAVRFMTDVFGLQVTAELDLPEIRVRTRFLRWGPVAIELIGLDRPEMAETLGGLPAKFDHLAIEVDDLDTEITSLRARGLRTETDEPRILGDRRTVFITSESAGGVRYQLLEGTSP